jgi:hypothetical protein
MSRSLALYENKILAGIFQRWGKKQKFGFSMKKLSWPMEKLASISHRHFWEYSFGKF